MFISGQSNMVMKWSALYSQSVAHNKKSNVMEIKLLNLDESKIDLEEQFILRLPLDDARYIRNILVTKPKKIKKVLQISLCEEKRTGVLYIKRRALPGVLYMLPTIVESLKTINRVNVYKTATVSQIMICDEVMNAKLKSKEEKENIEPEHNANKQQVHFLYPHGIAPPMKNVRKQRFRKTMRNQEEVKEAADVQKEVMLLLRTDYEAVSTRYEICHTDNTTTSVVVKQQQPVETQRTITEQMLFGNLSSDSEGSSTPSVYDIMDFN